MKTLKDLELSGKRVLVRVDFNVPMDDSGTITDDLRIRMALPTLHYLIAQKARVVLCTHMGRPKGKRVDALSLAQVATRTAELLGQPVPLAMDCIGPEAVRAVEALADGDCLMLENLRFHPEEEKNDPEFSRQLALLADVYVNDAFAVSHRAHASVVGVLAHVREKAAGLLLHKEME